MHLGWLSGFGFWNSDRSMKVFSFAFHCSSIHTSYSNTTPKTWSTAWQKRFLKVIDPCLSLSRCPYLTCFSYKHVLKHPSLVEIQEFLDDEMCCIHGLGLLLLVEMEKSNGQLGLQGLCAKQEARNSSNAKLSGALYRITSMYRKSETNKQIRGIWLRPTTSSVNRTLSTAQSN